MASRLSLLAMGLTLGLSSLPGAPERGLARAPILLTSPPSQPTRDDLGEILRDGVLRVGLRRDRTSFLVFRGQVLGHEFELLEAFANDLGVRLEVRPIADLDRVHTALKTDQVQAIGGRLGPSDLEGIRWSAPLTSSRLALVTGPRPASARSSRLVMPGDAAWQEERSAIVRALEPRRAPAMPRAEDVLRGLVRGDLAAAVVREDLARMASDRVRIHPLDARTSTRIGFSTETPQLAVAFDRWLANNPALVERLRQRYLHDGRHGARVAGSTTLETGTLSHYDPLFRRHADRVGLDWRLLAALSYRESRWHHRARSHVGAVGLMQLMPGTARQVGVRNRWDPAQSVRGGADYLGWLDEIWAKNVEDPDRRLPFVLASYNAGTGHVLDARRLAAAHGEDVDDWEVASKWLLRLQDPAWASHPVVQHGWCRGEEPVAYVDDIRTRWAHYRAVLPAAPERVAVAGENPVEVAGSRRPARPRPTATHEPS